MPQSSSLPPMQSSATSRKRRATIKTLRSSPYTPPRRSRLSLRRRRNSLSTSQRSLQVSEPMPSTNTRLTTLQLRPPRPTKTSPGDRPSPIPRSLSPPPTVTPSMRGLLSPTGCTGTSQCTCPRASPLMVRSCTPTSPSTLALRPRKSSLPPVRPCSAHPTMLSPSSPKVTTLMPSLARTLNTLLTRPLTNRPMTTRKKRSTTHGSLALTTTVSLLPSPRIPSTPTTRATS